jgi:hypothetical protein
MKTSISEIKTAVNSVITRQEQAKERISEM